jgi:hypothetical protein
MGTKMIADKEDIIKQMAKIEIIKKEIEILKIEQEKAESYLGYLIDWQRGWDNIRS